MNENENWLPEYEIINDTEISKRTANTIIWILSVNIDALNPP